jgi:acetyl esterase/lipase
MKSSSKIHRVLQKTVNLCACALSLVMPLASCRRGTGETIQQGATNASPPSAQVAMSDPHGPKAYPHARVLKKKYGEGALAYWLYLPADPVPASAPLILFLHGWNGADPYFYGGWLDHLARRGNIVIYPLYQTSAFNRPEEMLANAIAATKNAVAQLEKEHQVAPQLDKFAIVGHSFGGGMAVQVAALAKEAGLPAPKALMPVQPGWRGQSEMPTARLKDIPSSVLMLVVVGEEDQFASTRQGKTIFCHTEQIPKERKGYVLVPSDAHGNPPLIADHSSPLSPLEDYGEEISARKERRRNLITRMTGMRSGETDALDYLGYWRLFDALLSAAFSGQRIDAVIGSAQDLSLGEWSDKTRVHPLSNVSAPCSTP